MKKVFICLLCCACASKQKATLKQKLTAGREVQQEKLATEKVGFSIQHWQSDSSQLQEQVLIYPDGNIQFGPTGFVGQAKAVLWLRQKNQQSHKTSTLTAKKERVQQEEVKEVVQVQQEQRLSAQKKFSFAQLRWVFFLLLLIAAGAYWFWRKR